MKYPPVKIIGETQRQQAHRYIDEIPLTPVHQVIIQEFKETRSGAQNRLYWKWITEIGDYTGESKEEIHDRYKKDLARIYERDNVGFAEMITAVRQVHKWGEVALAKVMQREILKLTSTRDATVEQFAEYLTGIEMDSGQKGIVLTHPEDLYLKALGVEQ